MIAESRERSWNEVVGQRIREARLNLSLNQREFAEALGVRTATVSDWETGKQMPHLQTLRGIAQLTEVPIPWLRAHKVYDLLMTDAVAKTR